MSHLYLKHSKTYYTIIHTTSSEGNRSKKTLAVKVGFLRVCMGWWTLRADASFLFKRNLCM